MKHIFLIFLLTINLAAFAAMGIDKALSKTDSRRIPEVTLFFLCLAGGSIGGTLAMWLFHHKTRHTSFKIGFPLILILHIALALWAFGQ